MLFSRSFALQRSAWDFGVTGCTENHKARVMIDTGAAIVRDVFYELGSMRMRSRARRKESRNDVVIIADDERRSCIESRCAMKRIFV